MLIANKYDFDLENFVLAFFIIAVSTGYLFFRLILARRDLDKERKKLKERFKESIEESRIRSEELEKLKQEIFVIQEQFFKVRNSQKLLQ